MTVFDYAVLGVIAASLLLGLWRGVVSEILAIAAWVLAFFVAREFAASVSGFFAGLLHDRNVQYLAGFAAVFVGVLVVVGIVRLAVSFLLRAVGLGLIDRLLGSIFGVARGVLIVLIAVMLGGLTPLPKASWWQDAMLAPPLETAVLALRPWLPAAMAQKIRYHH
ncbi:MAG TPA: CvpA family protein [Rhodocyclaceae bacterium]|nr:CvpA family protein [Rhodocyclaceae bacterium]